MMTVNAVNALIDSCLAQTTSKVEQRRVPIKKRKRRTKKTIWTLSDTSSSTVSLLRRRTKETNRVLLCNRKKRSFFFYCSQPYICNRLKWIMVGRKIAENEEFLILDFSGLNLTAVGCDGVGTFSD
ncbi:hypothetical protein NE237_030181 [Protea cynaroides]|uniref:Uncharacterized protein n=1 Tax=Protea cynaroides TaxID=273540 RepID=A0A9Q0GXA8_9MAGN|nr:hypothetical protein NE237_030181 [Protea cynaroides]